MSENNYTTYTTGDAGPPIDAAYLRQTMELVKSLLPPRKRLMVHPDNVPWLLRGFEQHPEVQVVEVPGAGLLIGGTLELETNRAVPRLASSGRVIWPDGTRTLPHEHVGRFVQYEPHDLEWLIPLGGARWELEPVVWEVAVPRRPAISEQLRLFGLRSIF